MKGGIKMARPTNVADLPIIETDNEEGNIPNFLFDGDNDYGVSSGDLNFYLVERKRANKTIKDENGKLDHIEAYYKWDNVAYVNSLESAVRCYSERREKRLVSKLIKSNGFKEVAEIRKQTYEIIKNSLSQVGLNKELMDTCKLIDLKRDLDNEMKDLYEKKEQIEREFDKTMSLIKEKRSILIKETEPKKHRMKEENGDA